MVDSSSATGVALGCKKDKILTLFLPSNSDKIFLKLPNEFSYNTPLSIKKHFKLHLKNSKPC